MKYGSRFDGAATSAFKDKGARNRGRNGDEVLARTGP